LQEAKADKPAKDLALPDPNAFVPDNLDILGKTNVKEPKRKPDLIKDTEMARLWHKKDDRWWLPRASAHFSIKVPAIAASPEASIKARLFTDLVEDSLNEYSYDADLAGLSYSLHSQLDHFVLSVEGYNDKLPVLQKVVLERLVDFKVEPQRFELIKDRVRVLSLCVFPLLMPTLTATTRTRKF
jgi:insulysin